MKNFKKIICLALAIAMVLSSMTVMTGALKTDVNARRITTEDKAKVLHNLGLFNGISSTKFDPALDRVTTALEAIALIERSLKWKVEDVGSSSSVKSTFEDLNTRENKWAINYIKLAVAKGMTKGVSEDEFGVNIIDGKRAVTWFLRALGIPSKQAWEDCEDLAKEKGISIPKGITVKEALEDDDIIFNNKAKLKQTDIVILRRDIVDVIYDGLLAKPENSDKTIIEKMVEEDEDLRKVAEDANLIEKQPEELELKSIEGNNVREIEVTFNMELDKSKISKDNVKVKKEKDKSIDIDVTVSEDGMSIILTPKNDAIYENQEDYTVIMEDIMARNGMEIAEITKEVRIEDTKLANIEKLEVTGPRSFLITFDKPMKSGGKVTVESSTSSVNVHNSYDYGSRQVAVKLTSKLKDGVTYEVEVKDFIDYNGLENRNKTFNIEYEENKDPIEVKAIKATERYAILEFSKPLTNIKPQFFSHRYSSWKALEVYSDEDMKNKVSPTKSYKTIYVEFAKDSDDNPLKIGVDTIKIAEKYNGDQLEDNWGNKYDGGYIEVEVVGDTTPPSIISLTVEEENKLKVKFSEDVILENKDVEIKDEDDDDVVEHVVKTEDANIWYIRLSKSYAGKTIKIVISEVSDTSMQKNEMGTYTKRLEITDKSAPKITKVVKKFIRDGEQALYITFSEEVKESTAIDKSNYKIVEDGDFDDLSTSGDIDFYNDRYTVRIPLTDTEKEAIDDGAGLFVQDVEDLNDNEMVGKIAQDIKDYDDSSNRPKITRVEATGIRTLEVTIDQKLTDIDDDVFEIGGKGIDDLDEKTNEDGNTVLVLTARESVGEIDSDLHNIKDFELEIDDSEGETANSLGVKLSEYVPSTSSYKDKIAPKLRESRPVRKEDKDNDDKIDTILIKFDEDIFNGSVSIDKFRVSNHDVKDYSISGSIITVTIEEADEDDEDEDIDVDILENITDMNGNKFEPVYNKTAE